MKKIWKFVQDVWSMVGVFVLWTLVVGVLIVGGLNARALWILKDKVVAVATEKVDAAINNIFDGKTPVEFKTEVVAVATGAAHKKAQEVATAEVAKLENRVQNLEEAKQKLEGWLSVRGGSIAGGEAETPPKPDESAKAPEPEKSAAAGGEAETPPKPDESAKAPEPEKSAASEPSKSVIKPTTTVQKTSELTLSLSYDGELGGNSVRRATFGGKVADPLKLQEEIEGVVRRHQRDEPATQKSSAPKPKPTPMPAQSSGVTCSFGHAHDLCGCGGREPHYHRCMLWGGGGYCVIQRTLASRQQ